MPYSTRAMSNARLTNRRRLTASTTHCSALLQPPEPAPPSSPWHQNQCSRAAGHQRKNSLRMRCAVCAKLTTLFCWETAWLYSPSVPVASSTCVRLAKIMQTCTSAGIGRRQLGQQSFCDLFFSVLRYHERCCCAAAMHLLPRQHWRDVQQQKMLAQKLKHTRNEPT